MNEQAPRDNRVVKKAGPRAPFRRVILAVAGALVLIVALGIGLTVGGVRERLFGGVGAPRIESIAVVPFENASHDPAREYFADGMTAELISTLGQIGTVRVTARESVTRYKKAPKPVPEIARELGVDAVVEGGVLQTGDRVQFDVNLSHASTNRRLWAQTYDRDLRDVLDLQAEVTRAIALAIRAGWTPQEEARLTATRPVNPQAYEAYLRGVYGPEPGQAEASLKRAVELDGSFARPLAALASSYYWSNYFTTVAPGNTYPEVKEAAQAALRRDPELAEAHYYLALVAHEHDWDFVEAEKEFRRALELNPSAADIRHLYSHFLLSMGRVEESRVEDQRADQVNPADPGLVACRSWHAVATGNDDEAEKLAQRALEMGSTYPRLFLAWSYEHRGRFDEAIVELQKAVVGWGGEVFPTAALGHAYAVAGREAEAREVLDNLLARAKRDYASPYEIATVYAGLGDRDRAFEWLEKAYEERSNALARYRMDPRLRTLQGDARFQDLVRRMNFPEDRQK